MMDRELFNRCMDALRSGEYRQCRNWLHTPDGHCYQGVCMEVAYPGLKWSEVRRPWWEHIHYMAVGGVGGNETVMPLDLCEDIGLDMSITTSRIDDEGDVYTDTMPLWEYLAELNDGGFSLKFIAAVAESYVGVNDGTD